MLLGILQTIYNMIEYAAIKRGNMEKKVAVFLTGGGAKGAFQIGFFKALEEFGIWPDLVCGYSVGALLSGVATYMDSYEMRECWKALTLENILQIDSGKLDGLRGDKRVRKLYFETFLSCCTPPFLIDANNIRRLLYSFLDGNRILTSPVGFGISTTELPSCRMRKIFKEDMICNPLEYILASLYLPVFRPQRIIDGKHYLDVAFRRFALDMVSSEEFSTTIIVNVSTRTQEELNRDIQMTNFADSTNVIAINMEEKSSYLDFSEDLAQGNYEKGYESSLQILSRKLK